MCVCCGVCVCVCVCIDNISNQTVEEEKEILILPAL